MFISNNHAWVYLWRKKNLVKHQKVSNYYETDCRNIEKKVLAHKYDTCVTTQKFNKLTSYNFGGSLQNKEMYQLSMIFMILWKRF